MQELTRVAEYFEGVADEANVTVSVTGRATLTADVELFRRAISNLLANAIRYTPPRRRAAALTGSGSCTLQTGYLRQARSASAAQTAAALKTS